MNLHVMQKEQCATSQLVGRRRKRGVAGWPVCAKENKARPNYKQQKVSLCTHGRCNIA